MNSRNSLEEQLKEVRKQEEMFIYCLMGLTAICAFIAGLIALSLFG